MDVRDSIDAGVGYLCLEEMKLNMATSLMAFGICAMMNNSERKNMIMFVSWMIVL